VGRIDDAVNVPAPADPTPDYAAPEAAKPVEPETRASASVNEVPDAEVLPEEEAAIAPAEAPRFGRK
jgi:HemY protein